MVNRNEKHFQIRLTALHSSSSQMSDFEAGIITLKRQEEDANTTKEGGGEEREREMESGGEKLKEREENVGKKKKHLGFLDTFLSLWIILAMVGGVLVGVYIPSFQNILNTSTIDNVSLPVFIGLLLMLYPVFCKVKYEQLHLLVGNRVGLPYIAFSILLNWFICPFIMAGLAWLTMPDLPHFRIGVILIGVARCIAMVLIWNDLAGGDAEWCAILVSVNSVLQMLLFAPVAYFFTVIIGGGDANITSIQMGPVVVNVLIFLGIPFLAGLLTRLLLRFTLNDSKEWYDGTFVPIVSPIALLGLLYTIFIMFALQGNQMVKEIGSVLRVMVPLILYFTIVWISTIALAKYFKFPFAIAVTQAFTAGSNNFELAMAIAIATYGVNSQEALATTIGPLVEVPVLLGLVYLTPVVERHYLK